MTWRQTRLRIISTFRGAAVGGVWGWPAVADEGIPLLTPPPVTGSFLAAGLQPHSRRKIHFRLLRLYRLDAGGATEGGAGPSQALMQNCPTFCKTDGVDWY